MEAKSLTDLDEKDIVFYAGRLYYVFQLSISHIILKRGTPLVPHPSGATITLPLTSTVAVMTPKLYGTGE